MEKRRLKKSFKLGIIFAVLVLAIVAVLQLTKSKPIVHQEPSNNVTEVEQPKVVSGYKEYENAIDPKKVLLMYNELQKAKQTNSDAKAIIAFNNDIIHQPVVQGETNDTYLRTNWKDMSYDSYGSIFMDSWNNLNADDKNTIIYGHYIYEYLTSDRSIMFTPLELFKHQENYEQNKYVALVTDKEVRYYEVSKVFECPLDEIDGVSYPVKDVPYNFTDYTKDEFESYIAAIDKYQYYDTGAKPITYDDHIMTLQTCLEGVETSREVVVCREIGRNSIVDVAKKVASEK